MTGLRLAGGAKALGDERDARRRIDKWLWTTRLVKTRSAGAVLAQSGRIRLYRAGADGHRVAKPSFKLMAGDVLTVPLGRDVRVVEVLAFAATRGPAALAQALYRPVEAGSADGAEPLRRPKTVVVEKGV